MYTTRCIECLDMLNAALDFLLEPNSTIASAAKFPDLDPDFRVPAILAVVDPMGGSLRSDVRFFDPRQLDDVIHGAVYLQIMALDCQSYMTAKIDAQKSCLSDASLRCDTTSEPHWKTKPSTLST